MESDRTCHLVQQALRQKCPDLIQASIQPAMEDHVEALLEDIDETHQHMQKQVARLAELKLASEVEPGA